MYIFIKEKIISGLIKRWDGEGEINQPLWHSSPWESQCWHLWCLLECPAELDSSFPSQASGMEFWPDKWEIPSGCSLLQRFLQALESWEGQGLLGGSAGTSLSLILRKAGAALGPCITSYHHADTAAHLHCIPGNV